MTMVWFWLACAGIVYALSYSLIRKFIVKEYRKYTVTDRALALAISPFLVPMLLIGVVIILVDFLFCGWDSDRAVKW